MAIASYCGTGWLTVDGEDFKVMMYVESRRSFDGESVSVTWEGQVVSGCDTTQLLDRKCTITVPVARLGEIVVVTREGQFTGIGAAPF